MDEVTSQDSYNTQGIFKWDCPAAIGLYGPTQCGKTCFMLRVIKHRKDIFDKNIEKIIYCYSQNQEALQDLEKTYPNLELHKGLPTESFLESSFDTTKYNLLILDDLMDEIADSKDMLHLFIRGVHHMKITVFMMFQNLFYQGRQMRTISLNLSYHVLFKTFRDRLQIANLARQMFPDNWKRMTEAYEDAISHNPRGYLVVANLPSTKEDERLLTDIFPGENLIMYTPK